MKRQKIFFGQGETTIEHKKFLLSLLGLQLTQKQQNTLPRLTKRQSVEK
ncbi:MAG: hypothetical protein IJG38_07800 [Thermoguttaceae bacterium]|nr:hypothetical protein [Thermoguttaceae bacterium]MBQ6616237.1 hypothetical protein [Thermoguttaceae bacterium]